MKKITLIIMCLFCPLLWAGETELMFVEWDGEIKELAFNPPNEQTNRNQIVILAPGFSDGKWDPFLSGLASSLSDAGFTVIRFNWFELSKIKNPKLDDEKGLLLVLPKLKNLLKHKLKISKVNIVAKSWGMRIFANSYLGNPSLVDDKLVMLTPNCKSSNDFLIRYKPILLGTQSSLILISREDPYCGFESLEAAQRKINRPELEINYVKGNHSFRIESSSRQSYENFKLVSQKVTNFLIGE